MEQPFSTSKVTVEYHDPHDVYKLIAPGLLHRLPLRDLHWLSHAGIRRSIDTLHVEFVEAVGKRPASSHRPQSRSDTAAGADDGFTTQAVAGGRVSSMGAHDRPLSQQTRPDTPPVRRHQIPGLRRTPYLKTLLVRCDDNDTYKAAVRAEIREWIKEHTPPAQSSKKDRSAAENHDAYEWLIVHVVVPNTVASTQPRSSGSGKRDSDIEASSKSSTSRWRGGGSTLMDKLKSDFGGSGKTAVDRIAQIRIGINDVPYDVLPRVVAAVPSGYTETPSEAKMAWEDLDTKLRSLILSSFDMRVLQYEDDIKEKDAQRNLPGWNFCTFFILKEGLGRGFESVGLVEDALVVYDELSAGLDAVLQEQAAGKSPERHGGSFLSQTKDLHELVQKAMSFTDDATHESHHGDAADEIAISAVKKPYRELILANDVSIFDFRCYIFARQVALLLRLGNAWSTREELIAMLREQQDSVMTVGGLLPRAAVTPAARDEPENLSTLAEICRRTLEFIPIISQTMRTDLKVSLQTTANSQTPTVETINNVSASFAFSIAQQMLAQTSTKALPIPPSMIISRDGLEQKSSIPEPKTMMHPARSTSLVTRAPDRSSRQSTSPGIFPGPGSGRLQHDVTHQQFLKAGLEDLAARRAELYAVLRNILEDCGKRRGWSSGWSSVPALYDEVAFSELEDVSLDDDDDVGKSTKDAALTSKESEKTTTAGLSERLLWTAMGDQDDFHRLYETLTDKTLRHYTVAGHTHSVHTNLADLAILKYSLRDYGTAAEYFHRVRPFFGASGWSSLELSMLMMYSNSLKHLNRKEEYIHITLKLLLAAAAAERDRLAARNNISSSSSSSIAKNSNLQLSSVRGYLPGYLESMASTSSEIKLPLHNFFMDVDLDGMVAYDENQDSFSVFLQCRSLLADVLPVDKVSLRIGRYGAKTQSSLWLDLNEKLELNPGKNKIQLRSRTNTPGIFQADRVQIQCGRLTLFHERAGSQPIDTDKSMGMLQRPYLTQFQRADALDTQVNTSSVVQLDQNNAMDLELSTGWNKCQRCEIRVRAATGGLRLLSSEARLLSSEDLAQMQTPEAGMFVFSNLASDTVVKLRLPYTIEHDSNSVSVKVEVTYTTDNGTFVLSKSASVSLVLKLGVNVQDVFKHSALFSRFSISTASASPIRLFKTDLVASNVFLPEAGVPPEYPIVVFPKQPASLVYRIKRAAAQAAEGQDARRTMYLKLFYSSVHEEIEHAAQAALKSALRGSSLWQYSKVLLERVVTHIGRTLTGYDLERAATLGELPTSSVTAVDWERHLFGLGVSPTGESVASLLDRFITSWGRDNPILAVSQSDRPYPPHSILIPVDIPSMAVVHTADLRLQDPLPTVGQGYADADNSGYYGGVTPTVSINQLISANLHLKWTRMWDTEQTATARDVEFSYEVTAPSDTWLLAGRRQGHFIIPASTSDDDMASDVSNEADIPLLMVPLREGRLPYPLVEIREILSGSGDIAMPGADTRTATACETDSRNSGETVMVIADRGRTTVSLDASGPGGGPLVLESERWSGNGAELGRVIA